MKTLLLQIISITPKICRGMDNSPYYIGIVLERVVNLNLFYSVLALKLEGLRFYMIGILSKSIFMSVGLVACFHFVSDTFLLFFLTYRKNTKLQ